ncbi:hypothetical protein J3F84DRAFT_364951 [Trichoderma pleuroticola]
MGCCMCWYLDSSDTPSHSDSHFTHTQPRWDTKLLSNSFRLGESVREALLTHTASNFITMLVTMLGQM